MFALQTNNLPIHLAGLAMAACDELAIIQFRWFLCPFLWSTPDGWSSLSFKYALSSHWAWVLHWKLRPECHGTRPPTFQVQLIN